MVKSPVPGWSDAKFKGFIISALRMAFRRWPPKQDCIKNAYSCTKINPKTGRKCKHYWCAKCKIDFPYKEVQGDHTKPVVDPKKGFVDWDTWIERGFIAISGFQCLCKTCHQKKTDEERRKRNGTV